MSWGRDIWLYPFECRFGCRFDVGLNRWLNGGWIWCLDWIWCWLPCEVMAFIDTMLIAGRALTGICWKTSRILSDYLLKQNQNVPALDAFWKGLSNKVVRSRCLRAPSKTIHHKSNDTAVRCVSCWDSLLNWHWMHDQRTLLEKLPCLYLSLQ